MHYLRIGKIDYFINGKHQVGLEVMQNGQQLDGHLSRFAPIGRYADIAKTGRYFIIDCHEQQNDMINDSTGKILHSCFISKFFILIKNLFVKQPKECSDKKSLTSILTPSRISFPFISVVVSSPD